MSDKPAMRPLFVCGSPKSGTTWLQKILDAHPRIACAGEGHFVELIVRPMVAMLRAYNEKLAQVDERVFQGAAPYARLEEQEMRAMVRHQVVQLMLRQKPPPGTVWIGDKTRATPKACASWASCSLARASSTSSAIRATSRSRGCSMPSGPAMRMH